MRPVKPHYMLIFYRALIAAGLIFLFLDTHAQAQKPFIITVKTDRSFEISTHSNHTYSYEVDWGDGQTESGRTGNATHTYTKSGTYSIQISGQFPAIYFNNGGDKEKIVSVDQWGDTEWETMENAFYGCKNMDVIAEDSPNLNDVKSMENIFKGAESLKGENSLMNWDVSAVENMDGAFSGAVNFNFGTIPFVFIFNETNKSE